MIMPGIKVSSISERPEILGLIPGNAGKVLDIGCAYGDVGASIKGRFRCEVVGIEIDDEKAKIAASKLDRVIVGDVETTDLQINGADFDCIIFADVLEHLKDPRNVLRKYGRYLKDGGVFIISIPNVRHLKVLFELVFLGEWKYRPCGLMDEGHLRFFTLKSFKRLMESAFGKQNILRQGIKNI
jgi:2-polyprenyl-3-methyl-5-hydroxy-6-metoxy-1,4-benzoquinol methylase